MFKVELHSHCRWGSCDGALNEREIVQLLKEFGYDGFVLSNHYDMVQLKKFLYKDYMNISCSDEQKCPFKTTTSKYNATESELLSCYSTWLGSIKLAKSVADKVGIKCYAGMEYTLNNGNHIGVIGCTIEDFEQEFVKPERDIHYITDYAHRHGAITVNNHPYRRSNEPEVFVDGYEIVNTKHDMLDVYTESGFNHKSGRLGLFVCGSDIHEKKHVGRSYTLFNDEPKDEKQLARFILSGKYYNYILKDLEDRSKGYMLCEV